LKKCKDMVHKIYIVRSRKTGQSKLSEATDKDHAKNKELVYFPGHLVSDLSAKKVYDKNPRK